MSNIIASKEIIFVDIGTQGFRCRGTYICFLFKGVKYDSHCIDIISLYVFEALSTSLSVVILKCTVFAILDTKMSCADVFFCLELQKRSCFHGRPFLKKIIYSGAKEFLSTSRIYFYSFRNNSLLNSFIKNSCDTTSSVLYKEFNF